MGSLESITVGRFIGVKDAGALALLLGMWEDVSPPLVMAEAGRDEGLTRGGQRLLHGLGLRPFRSLGNLKLDLVAFIQGLVAGRVGNRRVMDEDIWPIFLRDKAKPFVGIKPLHGSVRHGMILLTGDGKQAATHERRIIKKPHPALISPLRPFETSRAFGIAGD